MKKFFLFSLLSLTIISCQSEDTSNDKEIQFLENELHTLKAEMQSINQRVSTLEKKLSTPATAAPPPTATATPPPAQPKPTYNFEGARFTGSAGIINGKLRFYSQSGNRVELSGVLGVDDVEGVAKIEGNKLICISGCRGTLTILENGKNIVGKMDGNSIDLRRR